VHFNIEAFRWCIAVKATLRGVYEMLGVGWLPHQPFYSFDDFSTQVFNRPLVNVTPSHILETVYFQLLESLIIWHARHELVDAIPIFEASQTQTIELFLLHLVIVRLHTLLLDPTLDIFELFTRRKRVVQIVLGLWSTAGYATCN
jgi:hypothetical protein